MVEVVMDGIYASLFMSCKCNEIAWQKASRPLPTKLLANLIKKNGNIAQYLCKHQLFFFLKPDM